MTKAPHATSLTEVNAALEAARSRLVSLSEAQASFLAASAAMVEASNALAELAQATKRSTKRDDVSVRSLAEAVTAAQAAAEALNPAGLLEAVTACRSEASTLSAETKRIRGRIDDLETSEGATKAAIDALTVKLSRQIAAQTTKVMAAVSEGFEALEGRLAAIEEDMGHSDARSADRHREIMAKLTEPDSATVPGSTVLPDRSKRLFGR